MDMEEMKKDLQAVEEMLLRANNTLMEVSVKGEDVDRIVTIKVCLRQQADVLRRIREADT